jgi:chromosome segregation ATPase
VTSTILLFLVVCFFSITAFSSVGWAFSSGARRRAVKRSSEQSEEVDSLRSRLSERDNEVAALEAKLDRLEREELPGLRSTLSEKQTEVTSLLTKVDRFEKKYCFCMNFINSLEPLVTQLAGDKGEYQARAGVWRNATIELLGKLRQQDAAEDAEAAIELAVTLVDTGLSHVIPHPSPCQCF